MPCRSVFCSITEWLAICDLKQDVGSEGFTNDVLLDFAFVQYCEDGFINIGGSELMLNCGPAGFIMHPLGSMPRQIAEFG